MVQRPMRTVTNLLGSSKTEYLIIQIINYNRFVMGKGNILMLAKMNMKENIRII